MYLGRIVEIGPAEQVTADPRHPYTKALLAAVPGAGVLRVPLKGEPASAVNPPAGCSFHPRCPVALDVCGSDAPPLHRVELRTTVGVPASIAMGAMGLSPEWPLDHEAACVLAAADAGTEPDRAVELALEPAAAAAPDSDGSADDAPDAETEVAS
jgi:oligopeptide/dipeptide ABC transporter ATP-binding protein